MTASKRADLVLEGGGVKGIGLVGAVEALAEVGYSFPRVAGTSAGAVVAALVAGLQRAGEPLSRLGELIGGLDYRRFRDRSLLGQVPLLGGLLALLTEDALYQGKYLEDFLDSTLRDLGVRTFGDLRREDPGASPEQHWSLVVTASDLSRKQLVRIPWDLPAYGMDPDEMSVATAVRASAAIPLFFRPVQVGGATWVDGGLLSDFPVGLFDRADSLEPRWPTFGVRLTTRPGTPPVDHPVRGPLAVAIAALDVLVTDQDAAYINESCTVQRTVFVPTDGVSAVDFGISPARSQALRSAGRAAGEVFLSSWDESAYLRHCRPASLSP